LGLRLANLTVTGVECDTIEAEALDNLVPAQFHHVMVLADDSLPAHQADSRTLVTLLHLRDIKDRGDHANKFAIVSELKDDSSRRLATVTRADDFVVGSRMIGLLLTQLATNDRLYDVFMELLGPGGVDIYLEPANIYVQPGIKTNFATVIASALRQGQTAIGYRLHGDAHSGPEYGVRLNPRKDKDLVLSARDRVIVLTHPLLQTGDHQRPRQADAWESAVSSR
jgi:hypothetical protein